MGVRIQPREIEVPTDDPFRNDLLGRKESIEVLTHLVRSFDGPCVLAVDAAWGNGKTTFLRIWSQYLRNHNFPVVEFNAWETDFSSDPFVALSTELIEGLQEHAGIEDKLAKTREHAQEVLRQAIPSLIRVVTAGILDVGPLTGNELGSAFASYAEARLSEYQEAQKSIRKFKERLQELAEALAQSNENRPLIVVVDELDRCRPSYAVELLEIAKHLFAVGHIVFVLAVNRSELAHSIKALYGNEFDASGYLRRFMDIDFRLPDPGRNKFIAAALSDIRIRDYFERTKDREARDGHEVMERLLQVFFRSPDLSLRQIAQAIHRLGLVFASLRSDQRTFAAAAVVALVLRTIDPNLYQRFCRLEVSDLDVVKEIFGRLGALPKEHERALFEATIIAGRYELANPHRAIESVKVSPLARKYQTLVDIDQARNRSEDEDRKHARDVLRLVEWMREKSILDGGVGFGFSVQRIELLSGGLIDKTAQI